MAHPSSLVGKPPLLVRGQSMNKRSGQGMLTHIAQGRVVDRKVGVTARSRSRKFRRLLLFVVPNQANASLPICVHTALAPQWRAPVSAKSHAICAGPH